MADVTESSPKAHGDPLVPLYLSRLRRLRSSQAFPPLAMAIGVFSLAVLFGGVPRLTFGFGNPLETTPATAPPIERIPTTVPVEESTTTQTLVDQVTLAAAVASAGFPDVAISVSGEVVTLTGQVPDQASLQALLQQVGAVEGVSEVLDRLSVRAASAAASVKVEVSQNAATVTGRVKDQATIDRFTAALAAVYRDEQIEIEALEIVTGAGRLEQLSVAGTVTDLELQEAIEQAFAEFDEVSTLLAVELGARPRVELELDALLADAPIEFESGSATITDGAASVLDEIAVVLGQFPAAVVEVGGHTDAQGPDDANTELSDDRATAVVEALRERGVEIELVAAGYGELRPKVVPETTNADRANNRRIEFRLL
ncbi:MAG: outer membrane protein OmpA-like peptidoglycan-associated protein [Acidimicrobiales bacterium]|jgi:outer membrane protein OmpA-like peptidoglycan-associated protein